MIFKDLTTVLDDLQVSWSPLPVALIDLTGGTVVTAGQCANYAVRRSMSYNSSSGAALYIPLPYRDTAASVGFDPATITSSLSQFPFSNLVVAGITNGGLRNNTSNPIVLTGQYSGITIPARSIYWLYGNAALGSSHQHKFQLCTDAGTQTGVSFTMTASIDSAGTPLLPSNTVTTTIRSTPSPTVSCSTDKTDILSYTNESKVVNYTYKFTAGGTEDLFSPNLSINYTDIIDKLTNSCGLTTAQAISRITVPAGFSALTTATSISTKSLPVMYVSNTQLYASQVPNSLTAIGSINYTGCTTNSFTVPTVNDMTANNISYFTESQCAVNNIIIAPPPT